MKFEDARHIQNMLNERQQRIDRNVEIDDEVSTLIAEKDQNRVEIIEIDKAIEAL